VPPTSTALTDARVGIIKGRFAADARPGKILAGRRGGHPRERAKNRQARLETGGGTAPIAVHWKRLVNAIRSNSCNVEAEILGQRAADLKKLADAWQAAL